MSHDVPPQPSAGFVRVIGVLAALLGLLAGYYWVHKPFDFALIGSLGGALLDAATVAALVVAAGGVGRRALGRLGWGAVSRAERLALEGLLGLGIMSSGALGLGLVGLFRGAALWAALLIVAVLLRRSTLGWAADLRGLFASLRLESGWTKFLALVVTALLALALIRALAPPHAWDALTYHLVGPSRYLAEGRIAAHADNHFLGMPQLAELLYAVAMSAFGRDGTAATAHFGFGALGLLAVTGLVRRCAGMAAAWLSMALLLSSTSLWLLFGWPYVDLAVMAFSAAALVAVTAWVAAPSRGWLLALGALVGLAFGVKYTAVGLALAVGLAVLVHSRTRVRDLATVGAAALLVATPWLLKGLLLYGNPVYPFFFGGLNWDAVRSATFSTTGGGLLASPDVWQLAVLPLAATVFGVEKGAGFAFTAGPWLLTTPLLLLPGWRWLTPDSQRLARRAAVFGLPLLLFWLLLAATSDIGQQTRLAMPLLPTAAVLGALGLHGLGQWPEKPVQVGFIVRAALALTLALGVVEAARTTLGERAPDYLLAFIPPQAALDANLAAHSNALRHLQTLPEGSRVRLMWEPRGYLCPATVICVADVLLDHWPRTLRQTGDGAAVFEAWRAAGDDYLLVWEAGYEAGAADLRFAEANEQFPAALAEAMTPVWTDGVRYTLYGWREE